MSNLAAVFFVVLFAVGAALVAVKVFGEGALAASVGGVVATAFILWLGRNMKE